MLLRVHQSNFRLVGFTELPSVTELAKVAQRHELPLVDDLGSGALSPSSTVLLSEEPSVRESLDAGADLVCFSGDKLLGGPQAGIVVGRAELVERLRRHPLQRAVRADKLTLAALEGTLALYLEPERALREVPVLRMALEDVRRGSRAGSATRRAHRRRRRGDRRPHRRRGAPARRAAELRVRRRGGARRAAASRRTARGRCRARRQAPARLPHAERRRGRGGRGRSRTPPADERPRARVGPLGRASRRTRHARARDRRRPRHRPEARRRPAAGCRARRGERSRSGHALPAAARARKRRDLRRGGAGRLPEHARSRSSCSTTAGPRSRTSSAASGYQARRASWTHPARPASPRLHGTDFWSWLAAHPDERALFDRAMEQGKEREWSGSTGSTGAATRRSSTSAAATARCSMALLERRPGLRGIVFDLPETVRDEAALGDRIRVRRGQLLRERARRATSTSCRRSSTTGTTRARRRSCGRSAPARRRTRGWSSSRRSSPTGNEPGGGKWLDLLMLALFAGRERNEAQWRELLERERLRADEHRARADPGAMPLTVGTAGHIDHGKTWLVRALTGKDTDRLPEEKERGISIDLGYAPLELPGGRAAVADRRARATSGSSATWSRARPASTCSCS